MVAGISIPAAASVDRLLRKIKDPAGFEDEELIAAAADDQIREEKDSENVLFKMMDYLTRPQSAVAGVMKDLIDGGDFSPFDRVGQALLGEERNRIKDVIDVISPGDWSRMKLPEWMGGKEIDPLKEGIGFVGDVMTDLLWQVPLFKIMGGLAKVGRAEAQFGKEIMAKLGSKGPMAGFHGKGGEVAEHIAKIGAVEPMVASVVAAQKGSRKAKDLFYMAAKDPEEFAKFFDNAADQAWFKQKMLGGAKDAQGRPIRGFLEKAKGGKRDYAAPGVVQRFEEGQQATMAFSANILGKRLGIPDISLTSAVDRKYTKAVLEGIGAMTEHAAAVPGVSHLIRAFKNTFKYGTGIDEVDGPMAQAMGPHLANEAEALHVSKDIVENVFGSRYNNEEFRNKVFETLDEYTEMFGTERTRMWDEAPEVMMAVEKMRTIERKYGLMAVDRGMKERLIERYMEGPEPLHAINRVLDEKGYAKNISTDPRKPGAPRSGGMNFFTKTHIAKYGKNVQKQMDARFKSMAGGVHIPAAKMHTKMERRELRNNLWRKDTKDFLDIAAEQAATTRTGRTTNSYIPHEFTEKAKTYLSDMLEKSSLLYRGKRAHAHFLSSSLGRSFKDMTSMEINGLIESGKLGHDYIPMVINHARKNLKNRADKKLFAAFMGEAGPEGSHLFFQDDPMGLIVADVAKNTRALTNHDEIAASIFYGGREVAGIDDLIVGEKLFALAPQAMKSVYGIELKGNLKSYYKSIAKRKTAEGARKELTDIFIEADTLTSVEHVAAGLKLWAMPVHLAKDINKRQAAMNSPDFWNGFLKKFDYMTNWWKGSVLAVFPGFHNRNMFTNLVHSAVAGAFSPKAYIKAAEFIRAAGYHKENPGFSRLWGNRPTLSKPSMGLDKFTHAGYSGNELYTMVHNMQVRGGSAYHGGTVLPKERSQFLESKISKGLKAVTLHHEGAAVKLGFGVGESIEEWQRIGHFFAELEKGMEPMAAKMSVTKSLFNYGEMTGLEKSLFKRVMPFYEFSRKNIPMWAEVAITKPHVFGQLQRTIEFLQTDEAKKMDRSLLPEFANKNFGIPLSIDKGTGDIKVGILGAWLSASELGQITSIHRAFDHVMQLGHPIPKTMMEVHTNRSFYTGRPIEEFPGEPDLTGWPVPPGFSNTKKNVHIFKSAIGGRFLNELYKMKTAETPSGKLSLTNRITNFLALSPKTAGLNAETLMKSLQFETNVRKGKLKRMLNKAKKYGTKEDVTYVKNLLKDAAGDIN